MADRNARDVLTLWRGCYQDARLIDTPWSDGERALALVHTIDFGYHERGDDSNDASRASTDKTNESAPDEQNDRCHDGVLLNGLLVRSPLAAPTGTYTAERATNVEGRPWVHLYRACVPDLPGTSGRRSSAQVYVKALEAAGLDMATSASLFTGLSWPVGRGVQAQMRVVTHQNVGLDPIEFARRTLVALGAAERAVRRRAARAIAAADAVTDAIDHEIDRLRTRILMACESASAPPHAPPSSRRPRHDTVLRGRRDSCHGKKGDRRPARSRRSADRHRDDCVEPVWCTTHDRWERASMSCADCTTHDNKRDGDGDDANDSDRSSATLQSTASTQSASESTVNDTTCSAEASRSSWSMPSSRAQGSAPLTSSTTMSSSPSPSASATTTANSLSSTTPASSHSTSSASGSSSFATTSHRARNANDPVERKEPSASSTTRASAVAFDITECSEDIYSCCSECCSSSGCSCSVEPSAHDTLSFTSAPDE